LQIRRTPAPFLIQRAGRYTGPWHIHQHRQPGPRLVPGRPAARRRGLPRAAAS